MMRNIFAEMVSFFSPPQLRQPRSPIGLQRQLHLQLPLPRLSVLRKYVQYKRCPVNDFYGVLVVDVVDGLAVEGVLEVL